MKDRLSVSIAIAALLLVLGGQGPVAQAQTIHSGTVEASADAQGQIRVGLDESADLLSGALPRQIVYAGGEDIVRFSPVGEDGDLEPVTTELGRGQQLTLRGVATLDGGQELTRLVQVTAYDRYPDLLVFEPPFRTTFLW